MPNNIKPDIYDNAHEYPKLARIHRVVGLVGNSKSWIYQEIAEGRFPKPISISKRNVAWIEQEIFSWIQERIKQSRLGGNTNAK